MPEGKIAGCDIDWNIQSNLEECKAGDLVMCVLGTSNHTRGKIYPVLGDYAGFCLIAGNNCAEKVLFNTSAFIPLNKEEVLNAFGAESETAAKEKEEEVWTQSAFASLRSGSSGQVAAMYADTVHREFNRHFNRA